MDTHDLMEEYYKTWNEYVEKKSKLDSLIQKWLDNDSNISSDDIQNIVDKENKEIDELYSLCETYLNEFKKITEEKAMRKNAVYTVRNTFNISPDSLIITGGVLSANKDESHLEGRVKTNQELELEKQNLLAEIKRKIMNREITLSEASNLKNKVEIAYNIPEIKSTTLKR